MSSLLCVFSRVGNSHFGFLSKSLFFCERKSNESKSLFWKKSDRAKSEGSDLLLGIKRGKAVKNRQTQKKLEIFWANHSFFESKSAISSQKRANHSHHSLLKSNPEWIALDSLKKICIFCTFFTAVPFLCPIENCSRHSSPCRSLQKSDHEWFAPVALYIRAMQVICSFSRAHCSFAHKRTSNSLEKPKSEFPTLQK